MAKALPEPGYYRSGDKDVIVIDPATVSDTGEVLTKDGDDARWQPAVIFKPAFEAGPTRVLSADVFDHRFKPTTRDEALARVQQREAEESKRLADEEAAGNAESADGAATAEGPTAENNP